MKTVINCPLCEWTYSVPPLDPRITPQTLAGVFGLGIFSQHAMNEHARRIEEVLAAHFATHTAIDWLTKVASLQLELALLKVQWRPE